MYRMAVHAQAPEREVAEVSVVGGIRMRGQERGSSAAAIPFDARARPEQRDAAVGERIVGPALRHQQRRARIPLEVLGVFGQSADQEDRVRPRRRRRSRTSRTGSPPAPGRACRASPSGSEPPGCAPARRAWASEYSRRTAARACLQTVGHVGLRSSISLPAVVVPSARSAEPRSSSPRPPFGRGAALGIQEFTGPSFHSARR